jgi:KipI family sensor histidine kinase inhibitor
MQVVTAGADALIVYFGDIIDKKISKQVYHALKILQKIEGFIEITPSYTSLMVVFDPLVYTHLTCKQKIEDSLANMDEVFESTQSRNITIPVLYDEEVGLDLRAISEEKECTIDEIIALHVKPTYNVYAIGFLPGFAYMGTIEKELISPRLPNPRAKVPKGSVAIAENQTAIYPQESPAGWRVLGRTPQAMFDTNFEGMSYLRVGDLVQFEPISKAQFLSLGGEI